MNVFKLFDSAIGELCGHSTLRRTANVLTLVVLGLFTGHEFEPWLGPQGELGSTGSRMKSVPANTAAEKAIGKWRISLAVKKGTEVKLEKSANATITVKDGRFVEFKDDIGSTDRKFLVGKMVLVQKGGSPNFYQVRTRIKSGPLAGAVVNLMDGTSRSDTGAPSSCVYFIPTDIKVDEGELSFEIFEVSYK